MKVVSLFDASGVWSQPWMDAGWDVTRVDLSTGGDVFDVKPDTFTDVDVVLAAPPCTHFTKSGARWWPMFDADGRTTASVALVSHVLNLIEAWAPRVFAIENPIGRINKLIPRLGLLPRWTFHPYHFAGWTHPGERTMHYGWLDAERAVKSTVLWGRYAIPEKREEPPCDPGGGHTVTSWIGPGKDRARKRSITPLGFSRAFFAANKNRARPTGQEEP